MPRKRKCRQQPDEGRTRDVAEPTPQPASVKGEVKARTNEPVEYTELVLLVHAGNMLEAELFKTELEAHGIPTMLEGEGAGVAGDPNEADAELAR